MSDFSNNGDFGDSDNNGDYDSNDDEFVLRPLRRTDLLLSHDLVDDAFVGALR